MQSDAHRPQPTQSRCWGAAGVGPGCEAASQGWALVTHSQMPDSQTKPVLHPMCQLEEGRPCSADHCLSRRAAAAALASQPAWTVNCETHVAALLSHHVRPVGDQPAGAGCPEHGQGIPMGWGLCFGTGPDALAGLRRGLSELAEQQLLKQMLMLCQLLMQLQNDAAPLVAMGPWGAAE